MTLYSLFIKQTDSSFQPVPVMIMNFRDSTSNTVNSQNNPDSFRFVSRFFLVDNMSGKVQTNSYISQMPPTIITYPATINFVYSLNPQIS